MNVYAFRRWQERERRKIYDLCTQALSSTLVSPVESTSTSRRLEVMRCDGCRCCVCHAPSKSKACWNPETTHDGQFQIELCKPSPASCLSQSESTRHSESAQPAMPQESIHRIIEKPPSKLEPRQPERNVDHENLLRRNIIYGSGSERVGTWKFFALEKKTLRRSKRAQKGGWWHGVAWLGGLAWGRVAKNKLQFAEQSFMAAFVSRRSNNSNFLPKKTGNCSAHNCIIFARTRAGATE